MCRVKGKKRNNNIQQRTLTSFMSIPSIDMVYSIIFLQQTLNNQELSAADVERMKHEKRELQKAIEQLEKERDYFDQQIWEKEMQYAKKHEEVSLEQ